MNRLKDIYIYGDSILKGIIVDKVTKKYRPIENNKINQLERYFPFNIKNKSKFGRTIDKGYKEIKRMIEKKINCDVAILEYGGNDCDHNWMEIANSPNEKHNPNTALQTFENTYFEIIRELKMNNIEPVIMSLPPIDSKRYLNWIASNGADKDKILQWLGDEQTISHYQEMYSLSATKIALETDCLFIDVRSEFLKHLDYRNLMCEDGIHPNEKGHELIANIFADFASNYFTYNVKIAN